VKGPALAFLLAAFVVIAFAGCTLQPKHLGDTGDDGPGGPLPSDPDRIADARPRSEPLNPGANNPYSILGRRYVPYQSLTPYRQRGIASWYGRKFHGKLTSSGERYDMYAMTAAHTILPIPSYARVTNLSNGRSVVVRVNDRGPFHSDRVIDLSYAAAYKLGYVNAGSTHVEVEAILPRSSAAARERRALPPV
jgi:peptidoglycan lytic transglycosylase